MRLLVRQMKHIAKVSVLLNVVVIIFLLADFLVTRVWLAASSGYNQGDVVVAQRSEDRDPDAAAEETFEETCTSPKKVLVFGMKAHWFQFCKFKGLERISHLVDFPRTVECPGLPCGVSLTYSEQARDIQGADIVAFSNVYNWLSPPMWGWAQGNRTDGQPWVMVSIDSPLYVPGLRPPDAYNEKTYNMLASYKLDSEVYIPYGFYQKYESPDEGFDPDQFWSRKNKMVAWISSNCDTMQWDRRKFVEDFKKTLLVDSFGSCGDTAIPWGDEKAVADVLSVYKFYLSLENSCCDDYVTEKFWRALDVGVVPIVVGASFEQYKKIAPPNSFIHVDQYGSMSEMVSRVIDIGTDRSKYLEYFKWRTRGKVVTHSLEEQYVAPLMESTFCGIVERYLKTSAEDRKKVIGYTGQRWLGSCKQCGTKWVKSYMKP